MLDLYKNLTEEERIVLSTCMAQHLCEFLSPIVDKSSLLTDYQYNNEVVPVVAPSFKLKDCFNKNKLQQHYGEDVLVDEDLIYGLIADGRVKKPMQEEIKHPSFGLMLAGKVNGRFELFDSPIQEMVALSISIKDAYFRESNYIDADERTAKVADGAEQMLVYLSSDQFVRMMMSREMATPCTIIRNNGMGNDALSMQFKPQVKITNDLKDELKKVTSELRVKAESLIDLLKNQNFTNKKSLSVLKEKIYEFQSMYYETNKKMILEKNETAKDVIFEFAKDLQIQMESEIQRLPVHLREQIQLPDLS
jgi:hypothetical protein